MIRLPYWRLQGPGAVVRRARCSDLSLKPVPPSSRQALKDREEAVRNGKLTTIIFIRDKNSKGQVRAVWRIP
jgi:hypothetical protein